MPRDETPEREHAEQQSRQALEEEVRELRRRVEEAPSRVRALEEKLLEVSGALAQTQAKNEKLTFTLQQAREHIQNLREEVEKLTQPPSAYGVYLAANQDGTADVFTTGRKMRVAVHPEIDLAAVRVGQEVVLNESFAIVSVRGSDVIGEVATVKDVLDDGSRVILLGRADEERVAQVAGHLQHPPLRVGDSVMVDPRSAMVLERLPRPEVSELALEEVPDITYHDIGGLDRQIEEIQDAVELPFLYRELFGDYRLPAPKGILLYGPRVRQDADRQGGRQLARQEGRAGLGPERAKLLLEREGSRAPQQVRR